MWQELEEEYKLFLDNMKKNEPLGEYLDESYYEDNYSHNEIEECQCKFVEMVKEWLHKNKPNEYIVTIGWCVFVMTIKEAQKRNLINYEQRIVH